MRVLLGKMIDYIFKKVGSVYEKMKNLQCSSMVLMGEGSRFHGQAAVVNFQRDRTKINIGKNTHIRGELLVFPYGGDIQIGDLCYIGEGSKLWSGEKIMIGDHVGIAHNVNIIDFAHEADHLERAAGFEHIFTKGHPMVKGNIPTAQITIEDHVIIYANSTILRGVTIGEGAVISAGSVVLTNVQPFTLMMGNPARPMKNLKK